MPNQEGEGGKWYEGKFPWKSRTQALVKQRVVYSGCQFAVKSEGLNFHGIDNARMFIFSFFLVFNWVFFL